MDATQSGKAVSVAELIVIIGVPIVYLVGVVGNLMTIIVLLKNKKSSTTTYLTFLAFADLTVILIVLPRWWLIYVLGIDVRHISNVACKLHMFVTYSAGKLSNMCLVAVTIERVVSTIRPHVVQKVCTSKIALSVCLAILGTLCLYNGQLFYGIRLVDVTDSTGNTGILGEPTTGSIDRFCNLTMDKNNETELEDAVRCVEFTDEPVSSFDMTSTIEPFNVTMTGVLSDIETTPFDVDQTSPTVDPDTNSVSVSDSDENAANTTPGSSKPIFSSSTASVLSTLFTITDGHLKMEAPVITETTTRRNRKSSTEADFRAKNSSTSSKACTWTHDPLYVDFYQNIFERVNFFFFYTLANVVFLMGGLIIVRKLALVKLHRTHMSMYAQSRPKSGMNGHSTRITITLLCINIVFFVCTTPMEIFLISRHKWIDQDSGMTDTQAIAWSIIYLLYNVNYAVNFLLYFLSGKKFRQQVMGVFGCRKISSGNVTTVTSVHRLPVANIDMRATH